MVSKTEEKKRWLQHLVREELSPVQMLIGYFRHYGITNQQREELLVQLVIFSGCKVEAAEKIVNRLIATLEQIDEKQEAIG